MQQFWKEWTRRWSLCRIKHAIHSKNFVPIPQEYKDDEDIIQNHNDGLNNEDLQPLNQHQSLFERFILQFKSKSLPREVLRTCPIGDKFSKVEVSKANLLNTTQLMGLTFFALTGVRFRCYMHIFNEKTHIKSNIILINK